MPGREADLVGAGVVVGVHGLRQHEPLVAVDRGADLAQLAVGLERGRGQHVAEQVVGADLQRGVVAELLRVADLRDERVQLLEGPLLGLLGHPVEVGDRATVGLEQVGDQLVHHLLRARREVPGDVLPADRLAERTLDQTDPALPAGPQLGGAGEGAAVEVEVGLDEGTGEVRRRGADRAHGQERAPVLDRGVGQHRLQVRHVRRLPDHQLGDRLLAATESGDPGVEVEARQRSTGGRSSVCRL